MLSSLEASWLLLKFHRAELRSLAPSMAPTLAACATIWPPEPAALQAGVADRCGHRLRCRLHTKTLAHQNSPAHQDTNQ